MPINSPRRGELNGLRGKFSRRCFFVVATVRLAKISLGSRLEKNVFEKREAIVDQRKIGFSFSTLIAHRVHPFPSISRPYFSSPHFSIQRASIFFFFFLSLVHPGPSIGPGESGAGQLFARFGRKRAKVHRFRDELPPLLLLLANLHSNAINVNRSASAHVETAPNSSLLEQPFAQRPRIIPPLLIHVPILFLELNTENSAERRSSSAIVVTLCPSFLTR